MITSTIQGRILAAAAAVASFTVASGAAFAQVGQPAPMQIGMQGAVTPVAESIHSFHDFVNAIIIAITVFVLALLVWVIVRYNAKANPTPARFSHNTLIEVAWTVVPILILVAIGVPSFKLLFLQYSYPKPDLTVKVTANAWYWDYEYPDAGVAVSSNMLRDEDILKAELGADAFNAKYGNLEDGLARFKTLYDDAKPLWSKQGKVRQLSVDNGIAVPVNAVVHMVITSNDVIHSWTVPSFGSKVQAVPGRVTATWFKATKPGVYFGQCSVLCGKEHSSMPIEVHVVEQATYDRWLAAAKAGNRGEANKILAAAHAGVAQVAQVTSGN